MIFRLPENGAADQLKLLYLTKLNQAEKMKKEIYINKSVGETRIAILEDDRLVEVYVEKEDQHRMVGNIYKGKVENVLPGMQAAFVNIGYDINAFLPFSEIHTSE
ncbi:MAG: S1 RNA-binding domain-containing protein, partial [Fidelibacterota bacterium]